MLCNNALGAVLLALSVFIPATGLATSGGPAVKCQNQVRARRATSGPQVAIVSPDVVCFGGNIDQSSATELVDAIKKVAQGHALTLVVNGSDGGDAASGMDVAEALSLRKSTVVANGICASSCANYLWLMADRRIITKTGLLIFHGGATLALVPELNSQIQQLAKAHPSINVAKMEKEQREMLEGLVRKQRALLVGAGVDPDFFSLFDQVTTGAMPDFAPSDCKAHPNAKFVVFSDNYLKSKGVAIERNNGPSTAVTVRSYLDHVGKKLSEETCFWN